MSLSNSFILTGFFFIVFLKGQNVSYSLPNHMQGDISLNDYKKIVGISLPLISKKYMVDSVGNGTVYLREGQDFTSLNFDNLIRKCLYVPEKNLWDGIIRDHFNNLFSSVADGKKLNVSSFDEMKKYLSLRVYPEEIVFNKGGVNSLIYRKDIEGTFTILMFDLPGSFNIVSKQDFAFWKMDSAEVFKIAQENINKQAVEKVSQIVTVDSVEIEIYYIESENYAASYALDFINNSPELVGEWGSVIIICVNVI